MLNSTLQKFFEHTAIRLNSENNMSDLTWSICCTSYTFKTLFINFFFEKLKVDSETILVREYSHESGRPDFKFENQGQVYVIEVKKYDTNLHDEYVDSFGVDKVAIIAIYTIQKKENGLITRTWKKFAEYIERSHTLFTTEREKELVEGYLSYLKKVCNIINLDKMILKNLTSLFQFNHLIEDIVQTGFDNFSLSINRGTKGNFHDRSGYCFSVTKQDINSRLDGWYGICFDKNNVYLCIGIWNGTHPTHGNYKVFEAIESDEIKEDGKYFGSVYFDEYYWIVPSDEINEEFLSDSTSIERQINILNDFFRSVITELGKYF